MGRPPLGINDEVPGWIGDESLGLNGLDPRDLRGSGASLEGPRGLGSTPPHLRQDLLGVLLAHQRHQLDLPTEGGYPLRVDVLDDGTFALRADGAALFIDAVLHETLKGLSGQMAYGLLRVLPAEDEEADVGVRHDILD